MDDQSEIEQIEDVALAQTLTQSDSAQKVDVPEKTPEKDSMRDALSKAYDDIEKKQKNNIQSRSQNENQPQNLENSQDQSQTPVESTEEEVVLPPYSFNKIDKEEFAKLPTDMKKIVAKRMHEMERGLSQIVSQTKEKTRFAEQVEDMLEPYKHMMAVSGNDPISGLKHLLALNDFAHSSPVEYIKWTASQLGVDLRGLTDMHGQQQLPSMGGMDPQFQQLQNQVSALSSYIQQQEQSRLSEIHNSAGMTVSEFINATDSAGNPKYPYVEQLAPTMRIFIENDPTGRMTLEEAYDRALYADPSTRETMIATQKANMVKSHAATSQQEVERARAASFGNKGSGYGSSKKEPSSMRDALSQAWDQTMGG